MDTLKEGREKRLKEALRLKKYGHLKTWQELFIYQGTCKNGKQFQEIADWAKRKNKGEPITLPLVNYNPRERFLKKASVEPDILKTAKEIFKK